RGRRPARLRPGRGVPVHPLRLAQAGRDGALRVRGPPARTEGLAGGRIPGERGMKVVHVSWDPLSAAPYRLASVQRLCGLEARLISEDRAYGNRRYPYDVLIGGDRDLLAHLLEEADLIHYHNWWRHGELFQRH